MTQIIKQAIRIGNSSGVLLPRGWESKKVKVELLEDSISNTVLEILKTKGLLGDVIGIYLVGSYARGEEKGESDIDLLVISGKTNKIIKEGDYEVLIVEKEKLERNMGKDLYLYSMIKEAKAIMNENLLKEYRKVKLKIDLSKLKNKIKKSLENLEEDVEIAEECKTKLLDGTIYSLMLRLREIVLMLNISSSIKYSNKDILKILERNEISNLYLSYLRVKNDKKLKNDTDPEGARVLIKVIRALLGGIKDGKKRTQD